MQTIAELLQANNLDFGGCFLFKRKVLKCDKKGFLFSTLAYQLAINLPGMREYINLVMENNPALPTRSAAIQLDQLILNLLCASPSLVLHQ